MALLNIYFCTIASAKYILKNGKEINFVDGKYYTDDAVEIEELDAEIKSKHPHIYIKEDELKVEAKLLDPMEALRAKFFAEFQAQQESATQDPNRDMGESKQEKLNIANSQTVASAMAGGSGTALGARLAQLTIKSGE